MSDTNIPPTEQDLSESTDSTSSNWFTGWDNFSVASTTPSTETPDAQVAAEGSLSAVGGDTLQEWQTVEFPTTLAAEKPEPVSPFPSQPLTNPAPSLAGLGETPDVADLIGLIQELNQCNNALLDRVSQLEDALERQQKAASELEGSHDFGSVSAQELALAQQQVTELFEQLEAAHQISKRQQILIETLTGQLESSQERVAQLERECTLVQQRYQEQAQLLTQSDNVSRDLRARLQRQQRYTLQFKAALEKCLEVSPSPVLSSSVSLGDALEEMPAPWYDPQSSGAPQPLLPKVHRIRPWSSQLPSPSLEKFTPFQAKEEIATFVDSLDNQKHLQPIADEVGTDHQMIVEAIATPSDPEEPPQADLIQFPMALQAVSKPVSPVSYDLKSRKVAAEEPKAIEMPNPELPNPELSISDSLPLPSMELPPEVIQAGLSHLESALGELLTEAATASSEDENGDVKLWQDLARLIDVSAEDVVKASLAGDFTVFETIQLPAASATVEVTTDEVADTSPTSPKSKSEGITPFKGNRDSAEDTSAEKIATLPNAETPFANNPSWPSPLVHPLRPPRKLSSLAAVDLPRFGR